MDVFFSYAHSKGFGNCILKVSSWAGVIEMINTAETTIQKDEGKCKVIIMYWKKISD